MRTYMDMEPQGSWDQEPNFERSDFSYGAKTTTSLASATNSNNATFDLPNWMETTDFLGLDANSDMWNTMFNSSSGINPIVSQQWETMAPTDAIVDLDNKDILNIQPEDMLVPLSDLQPKTIHINTSSNITTDMQAIQQQPLVNQTPVENQKIVICVRKVSVPNNKERSPAPTPYIVVSSPKQNVVSQQVVPQYSSELSIMTPKAVEMNQVGSSQSDQLLDELMQMIGSDVKPEDLKLEDLTETLEAFDNDAFVDGTYSEIKSSSYSSELNYCHALPSPVPSVGSLSPCHSDRGFLSPPQTVAFVDMSLSPRPCTTVDPLDILSPPASVRSELNVMSPAPSVSEISFGSPAFSTHNDNSEDSDSQDSSFNVSQDELHSYSRSTNKSKSSRRSNGSRSTPYPESRRERKKEQNKQAALRYRQKKKQEEEDAHNLLKREEEKQKELKEKYSNIKQEMTYLKKIMREVFIAKGVLSADSLKKSN